MCPNQVFPKIPAPGGVNPTYSECGRYALAVKPKKGDAILFVSIVDGYPTFTMEIVSAPMIRFADSTSLYSCTLQAYNIMTIR